MSSTEIPESPTSPASRTVSATTSGASPKPLSKSPETGKPVHFAFLTFNNTDLVYRNAKDSTRIYGTSGELNLMNKAFNAKGGKLDLVCKCFAIDAVMIEDVVKANGLNTVEEVTFYTKAGGGCAACHEGIEEILAKVMAERAGPGEVSPPPACPATPEAPKPPSAKLTLVQKIKKIEEVLESVRPMLQRDHGDVELADVQGKKIFVHLKGACSGCMMEAATLGGIQQKMIETLGELVQVLPSSHMPVEA